MYHGSIIIIIIVKNVKEINEVIIKLISIKEFRNEQNSISDKKITIRYQFYYFDEILYNEINVTMSEMSQIAILY